MTQCKIKRGPLRLKLIIQEPFEREGELFFFFSVIRARERLPLLVFPVFLYPHQSLQPEPGEQTLRADTGSLRPWGCVNSEAWRACADLSARRLPARLLLGAGLAQPQLQAGDHLGENGRKLDPPVVGGDRGPSSPGLPRKAGGPLLCLLSGRLGSESTGWSRGSAFPVPGYKLQGTGTKDAYPTRRQGTAQCPGAFGLCRCFVFHLHPSCFSRSGGWIQEERGSAPNRFPFYNSVWPGHKMEIMNDTI